MRSPPPINATAKKYIRALLPCDIRYSMPPKKQKKSENRKYRSMFLQQLEHLAVELVSIPVFVSDVSPPRIQEPEIPDKIPWRKADTRGLQDVQHISEPRDKNIMRRHLPTSALAAMHPNAL